MLRNRLIATVSLGIILVFSVFSVAKAQLQPRSIRLPRLQSQSVNPESRSQSIVVDGLNRTYLIHRPQPINPSRASSLILAFHGGGGDSQGMEALTGLSELSDQEGFIVVYPQALNGHWNDRRDPRFEADGAINDLKFVRTLIAQLQQTEAIDPRRIFATGISNGGFFTQALACDLSQQIAAVAVVASNLPQALSQDCQLSRPVSITYFLGTSDPLMPYNGGVVMGANGRSATVLSALDSFNFWLNRAGIQRLPRTTTLPDRVPSDGTTVQSLSARNFRREVTLYTIQGGGHTWPSGLQYLPVPIIGRTSSEINASTTMWQFFQAHPLTSR